MDVARLAGKMPSVQGRASFAVWSTIHWQDVGRGGRYPLRLSAFHPVLRFTTEKVVER